MFDLPLTPFLHPRPSLSFPFQDLQLNKLQAYIDGQDEVLATNLWPSVSVQDGTSSSSTPTSERPCYMGSPSS